MSGIRTAAITPAWPVPARVHALTTTRDGPGVSVPPFDRFNLGLHVGDDALAVAANRTRLVRELGLPAEPHWLEQVHGTGVAIAGEDGGSGVPVADAAITRLPRHVLAIQTADCLPMLMAADDGTEIAAIHAGWRGLAAGVIEAALARLRTPRERTLAWLGPAIGPDAYEVGDDVRDACVRGDSAANSAFRPVRAGHWLCDLYALARHRLAGQGVLRVTGGEHCTLHERERFYSYRRDGATGRMATLIWIEGDA